MRSTPGSKVKPTLDKQSCSILMSDLSQGLARTDTRAHTHTHTHRERERERERLICQVTVAIRQIYCIYNSKYIQKNFISLNVFDSIYLLIQHTFVFEISLLCSLTLYLFDQKDSKNSRLILWNIITIYKKCFLFEYM